MLTFPEKFSMAAPQKVDARAMPMPEGDPARLPSQMASTTPSVSVIRDKTSNLVGTCMHMVALQRVWSPTVLLGREQRRKLMAFGCCRRFRPLSIAKP